MKKTLCRILVILLLISTVITAIPQQTVAADGSLYVSSYSVTDSAGKKVGSFQKGAQVNLEISLKHTGITTDSKTLTADNIDVTRLIDSFTGGTVTKKITSSDGNPLEFTVTISKMTYNGSGKSVKLAVGFPGKDSVTVDAPINEAVEYEPPKPYEPPVYTPEIVPQPIVFISRSEISKPIEAGQQISLNIYFKNLGPATVKSAVATITTSESLTLGGGSSSFIINEIPQNRETSISIKLTAADTIASISQSLGVDLKFNYYNGSSTTQGSTSEKISIPAKVKVKDSIPQPTVIITRSALQKPISVGEEFDVTLSFKNAGKTALISPVASFSTSEALIMKSDVSTFVLEDLAPGKSTSVTVKLGTTKEISSTTQSLNVDLKYSYNSGDTIGQGSTSDKVYIAANTTSAATQMDSAVPNLIISSFDYGGQPVAAGDKFSLTFKFLNTNANLSVENIVATIDSGENFTMDGATNTFFYKKLGPGREQSQTIPLQAMATAKSGARSIDVNFKYEYIDNKKRSSSTAAVKISIPIYQPDRFQVNPPALPESAAAGEELSLSLAYVNKGKAEVSNVEASIEGDVSSPAKVQNLGNFESGKSGSIGFVLTPEAAGTLKFLLKVSYEDANQQVQIKEFPVTLEISEPVPVTPEEELPEEAPSNGRKWLWIALAAASAGAIAGIIIIRKKKKGKKDTPHATEDWSNWDEESFACSFDEEAADSATDSTQEEPDCEVPEECTVGSKED